MKKILFWIAFIPGCVWIILSGVVWMLGGFMDYTNAKMNQFESWCFDRNN